MLSEKSCWRGSICVKERPTRGGEIEDTQKAVTLVLQSKDQGWAF